MVWSEELGKGKGMWEGDGRQGREMEDKGGSGEVGRIGCTKNQYYYL